MTTALLNATEHRAVRQLLAAAESCEELLRERHHPRADEVRRAINEAKRQLDLPSHTHTVQQPPTGLLHLENWRTPGVTVCGRRCTGWNEKSAECWELAATSDKCALCSETLGPRAVIKP